MCHLQHKLIGFYNRDEKCLLCGTDWVFKGLIPASYSRLQGIFFLFQVIPFLVLAVGVDNIFILVHTHQREGRKEEETHEEHVGRTLGRVGPSMLLTSVSEAACFLIG